MVHYHDCLSIVVPAAAGLLAPGVVGAGCLSADLAAFASVPHCGHCGRWSTGTRQGDHFLSSAVVAGKKAGLRSVPGLLTFSPRSDRGPTGRKLLNP